MPLFRTYQPGQTNPKAKPKTPDQEPNEVSEGLSQGEQSQRATDAAAGEAPPATAAPIKHTKRPQPAQPAEAVADPGATVNASAGQDIESQPAKPAPTAASAKGRAGDSTAAQPARAVLQPKRAPKGAPTPTRDQALATRKALINPTLTPKEAKQRAKASQRVQAQTRYRASEMTPERVLVRNFVDSHFSVGELLLPLMVVIVLLSFVSRRSLALTYVTSAATIAIFFTWIGSITVDWIRLKRLLKRRLPEANRRGLLVYMMNRMMVVPRWRRPEAQVKRGDKI